jgi:hypothetical protein
VNNNFIRLLGARGDEWQRAIGQRVFPVTGHAPEAAIVLGVAQLVYFVDLTELNGKTRERIEHYLAEKYRCTLEEMRQEIKTGGIPIIARGLVNPQGSEI